MEAKKQLRKPENWEDFESLCKKLWSEVWDCQEIKKNGRKGQVQNGVDIYGIPKGKTSYYGIQCKGKDEYSHKQLSKNEIDNEINLAKSFKPPLTKFYFATTANKDSKIEEYIRIKDIENRKSGLFEIHIFSWEDIVDLIDENKQTHDWYLNLHKFKQKADVLVYFENDKSELTESVPFCEKYTYFQLGNKPSSIFDFTPYEPPNELNNPISKSENKSYFKFKFKIKNIGNTPIENPKITFQIDGKFQEIRDINIDNKYIPKNTQTDIEINDCHGNFFIVPKRNILALEEEYITDLIFIKPIVEGGSIKFNWKLISNNFKKEGKLNLRINTFLIRKDVDEYVDFRQQVRVEKSIVDYIDEIE